MIIGISQEVFSCKTNIGCIEKGTTKCRNNIKTKEKGELNVI